MAKRGPQTSPNNNSIIVFVLLSSAVLNTIVFRVSFGVIPKSLVDGMEGKEGECEED